MPTIPGSTLITALEQAWHAIQRANPDVPDVLIILGSGRRGRSSHQLRGYHEPERWLLSKEEGRLPELFIAGEHLALGGAAVLTTMLHEAAHSLAYVRNIKDCSRSGNRYHNRRFAHLAEEVGLLPPAHPSGSQGYSDCALRPETAEQYRMTIVALDDAIVACLDTRPTERPGIGGRRFAITCACHRRLQVSPRSYADGPIICGNCGERFLKARAADESPVAELSLSHRKL